MQVQFLSPLRGWLLLTSTDNAGSVANALFATTDGGKHWQEMQVPLPSTQRCFGMSPELDLWRAEGWASPV